MIQLLLTQSSRRNTFKECFQNFMEIDWELTDKSAKKTPRWWKRMATINELKKTSNVSRPQRH